MDAKQIREQLMNNQSEVVLLDASLPGLLRLDGQIYVCEISGKDMIYAKERATDRDGTINATRADAAIIARSLISRDAYDRNGIRDRIFSDDDIEFIENFGSKIMLILVDRVNKVSGMTADFLKQLGPSSTQTTSTDSASS